jgi:RimJ/RimL family protein N-acetyltransferase
MKYLLENQQSERLYFRLLERSDFDTWIDLFREPGVAGFIGMDKIPTPEEQCEAWFQKVERRYREDLGGMNVLIDKATGDFIGQCGLLIQEVDGVSELEIGYSILPQHWGKGYAAEAARKCRDYAFENRFSEHLISIVHIDNVRSARVAEKNGMRIWKTTTFWEMPVNIFRIDRQDWEDVKEC